VTDRLGVYIARFILQLLVYRLLIHSLEGQSLFLIYLFLDSLMGYFATAFDLRTGVLFKGF
jgi:hypothetical protein